MPRLKLLLLKNLNDKIMNTILEMDDYRFDVQRLLRNKLATFGFNIETVYLFNPSIIGTIMDEGTYFIILNIM